MVMTTRECLIAMGYREEKSGIEWAKPVGYHLFTYSEKLQVWDNWFRKLDGNVACWDSKELLLDDPNFLTTLKEFEAYTRINVAASAQSNFELSGLDL